MVLLVNTDCLLSANNLRGLPSRLEAEEHNECLECLFKVKNKGVLP